MPMAWFSGTIVPRLSLAGYATDDVFSVVCARKPVARSHLCVLKVPLWLLVHSCSDLHWCLCTVCFVLAGLATPDVSFRGVARAIDGTDVFVNLEPLDPSASTCLSTWSRLFVNLESIGHVALPRLWVRDIRALASSHPRVNHQYIYLFNMCRVVI